MVRQLAADSVAKVEKLSATKIDAGAGMKGKCCRKASSATISAHRRRKLD
jgi:hypothetical protein